MKNFFNIFSYSLVAAVIIQGLCQLTKLVYYSIKDRKFTLKYLFTAGGMPSAHSAFVTSLTVSVGFKSGFNTDYFAIAFVFAAIIIYDAYRLRGTVQKHSYLLDKLKELHPDCKEAEVNKMVGHSIPEILAGVITGGLFAVMVYLFIRSFNLGIFNY